MSEESPSAELKLALDAVAALATGGTEGPEEVGPNFLNLFANYEDFVLHHSHSDNLLTSDLGQIALELPHQHQHQVVQETIESQSQVKTEDQVQDQIQVENQIKTTTQDPPAVVTVEDQTECLVEPQHEPQGQDLDHDQPSEVKLKAETIQEIKPSQIQMNSGSNVDVGEIEVLPTPPKPPEILVNLEFDDPPPSTSSSVNYPSNEPTSPMTSTSSRDPELGHNEESISVTGPRARRSRTALQTAEVCKKEKFIIIAKDQDRLIERLSRDSLAKCSGPKLTHLSIRSNLESNLFLMSKQVKILTRLELPNLTSLDLGVNIDESVEPEALEALLKKFSSTLTHFSVSGGYVGRYKVPITIRVPSMPKLEVLSFQSNYKFDTETETLTSDPEVVELDSDSDSDEQTAPAKISTELFPICLHLPKLDHLKQLTLGKYIGVVTTDPEVPPADFYFDHFPKLEVFHVGSPWGKSVKYLPKTSRKYRAIENVTSIQFPDLLQDTVVLGKVAEEFPNLKCVHLNLPSARVLQEFLQVFGPLNRIKRLHIKTSYIFSKTFERIICGTHWMKYDEEERKIQWIKTHGKFDGFDYDDQPKTDLLGLCGLSGLKDLHLEHVPRKIHLPKFNVNLGFDEFPTSESVIEQIVALNLGKMNGFPGFKMSSYDSIKLRSRFYLSNDGMWLRAKHFANLGNADAATNLTPKSKSKKRPSNSQSGSGGNNSGEGAGDKQLKVRRVERTAPILIKVKRE